jgi:hypothetical protein
MSSNDITTPSGVLGRLLFAVSSVALMIAVGEPRCDVSQVASPEWLTAQRTGRLRAGCPAIHQNELLMPAPNAKRNKVSALCEEAVC